MRNYTSYLGSLTFFDDARPAALPPPGGAVYKRPPGSAWAEVPEIVGAYECGLGEVEECSCPYCREGR